MTDNDAIEILILLRSKIEHDHAKMRHTKRWGTRDEWFMLQQVEAFDHAIAAIKTRLDVPRGWVTTPKQYHEDD